MKISEFLCKNAIKADMKGSSKKEILDELVSLLVKDGAVDKKYKNRLVEVLMAREALGSTAIGQGIAIPHGKSEYIKKLVGGLGISKKGIDFDSLDGEPAHIFFVLFAPIDSAGPHLKALARISRLLKDKYFREKLKAVTDEKAIAELISQEDGRLP